MSPGQPHLHNETLSQNKQTNKEKNPPITKTGRTEERKRLAGAPCPRSHSQLEIIGPRFLPLAGRNSMSLTPCCCEPPS